MASKVITAQRQVAAAEEVGQRLARIEQHLGIIPKDEADPTPEAPTGQQVYVAAADIKAGQKVAFIGSGQIAPLPEDPQDGEPAQEPTEPTQARRPRRAN